MPEQNKIHIVDTTNRDGVRTSRLCLSKLQKTMINIYLKELGVCESEFGFPSAKHEINYINANCKLHQMGILKPMQLRGWINAVRSELDEVLAHTQVEHLYLSAQTYIPLVQSHYGQSWNLEKIVSEACHTVEKAKAAHIKTVAVGTSDASQTSDADLLLVARRVRDAGADRFRYCDTWGYENPWTLQPRIKMLATELKIPIEIHCHNDLNLAVANTLAGAKGALEGGVDSYISTTTNGIGERAGNADLLSVILALKKSKGFRETDLIAEKINLAKVWRLATYTSYATGIPILPNQVGVGPSAVSLTTGLHADGAVREVQDFEVFNVEELGRSEPDAVATGRWITSGAYTGIRGFRNIYGKLEIEFKNEAEAHAVLDLVRQANVHNHRQLTGDELRFIAKHPEIAQQLIATN